MHHQDGSTNDKSAAGRAPLRVAPSGLRGTAASPLRAPELGREPDGASDDCDMESVMVGNDVREAARWSWG